MVFRFFFFFCVFASFSYIYLGSYEPATWALFGVGALMLAVYAGRRRNSSAKIA